MTNLGKQALAVGKPTPRLRPVVGTALALMGALGFATSGPLSEAVLAAGLSPLQLSQVRQTISALVLFVVVLLIRPSALRLRLTQLPSVMLYGITSYMLLQTFYFFAISRIPIGIALLIQFTAPIWVALWVRFVRGTRLPTVTWIGAGVVLLGLVLVGEGWHGLKLDLIGVLAAIGTALCLTCFYLMAERGLADYDPLGLVALGTISAAVLFAIVQPIWNFPFHSLTRGSGLPMHLPWSVWVLVLVIGVCSTALPAVLEVTALLYLASPTASVLGAAEVIGGAVFAWVLIDQTLTPPQLIGGLIVVTGIVITQVKPLPQTRTVRRRGTNP